MPTVINNPGSSEGSGMGAGLILGIVIAGIIVLILIFYYGIPALRGGQNNGTLDVNVDVPALNNGGTGGQNSGQ